MSIGSIGASLASSIAFSAVPPVCRACPAGTSRRPWSADGFSTSRRWSRTGWLRFRTTALGGDDHVDGVARHHLDVDHARVLSLVLMLAGGISQHRGAQLVVRVHVGAANALIGHLFHAHGGVVPAHVHADFQEHGDDAGVLADRAVALGMRGLIRIWAIASFAGDSRARRQRQVLM